MRRLPAIFSRDSLRSLRECVIDGGITVVMLSVAAVAAGMMLMAALLSSCNGDAGGKKKSRWRWRRNVSACSPTTRSR